MLHHPADQFAPSTPAAVFDAETFVRDMRATGAKLNPIRGPRGAQLSGRFSIEMASADYEAMSEVVERHTALMTDKTIDCGRVAEFLFVEAASTCAAAVIGPDLAAGLHVLDRLSEVAAEAYRTENEVMKLFDSLRLDPPTEVRWHPMGGVDAAHTDMLTRDGKRISIYSKAGIEQLRTKPRSFEWSPSPEGVEPFQLGADVEPRTEVEREWVERRGADLRGRADKIVAAYDAWQAACESISAECGFSDAEIASDIAGEHYFGAVDYVSSLPILSPADAALKAQIALKHDKDKVEEVLAEIAAFLSPPVEFLQAAE